MNTKTEIKWLKTMLKAVEDYAYVGTSGNEYRWFPMTMKMFNVVNSNYYNECVNFFKGRKHLVEVVDNQQRSVKKAKFICRIYKDKEEKIYNYIKKYEDMGFNEEPLELTSNDVKCDNEFLKLQENYNKLNQEYTSLKIAYENLKENYDSLQKRLTESNSKIVEIEKQEEYTSLAEKQFNNFLDSITPRLKYITDRTYGELDNVCNNKLQKNVMWGFQDFESKAKYINNEVGFMAFPPAATTLEHINHIFNLYLKIYSLLKVVFITSKEEKFAHREKCIREVEKDIEEISGYLIYFDDTFFLEKLRENNYDVEGKTLGQLLNERKAEIDDQLRNKIWEKYISF